jgi:hypothetical protein
MAGVLARIFVGYTVYYIPYSVRLDDDCMWNEILWVAILLSLRFVCVSVSRTSQIFGKLKDGHRHDAVRGFGRVAAVIVTVSGETRRQWVPSRAAKASTWRLRRSDGTGIAAADLRRNMRH